jgi:diadenosine tetraphosphate (Ap4A) HIT family hydrolase
LCDEKLNEFLEKRGIKLWDYRLIDNPVPDSLRFRVLKDSDFRCELCGATKKDRPLDVDHIIPRSKGGKTEEANLQVLCSKCNRSKGNKDKTDFRDTDFSDVEPDCVFCGEMDKNRIQDSNGSVFATKDKYPVTKGHHLIIPFRHTEDYFSMTEVERQDSTELIRKLKRQIQMSDTSVQGFNVGSNSGEVAGQTVAHAHIHLIPRRDGDTPHPKGGVRGVIPDKMDY